MSLQQQPDDPGPDYAPLTFQDSLGNRSVVFFGDWKIGEILPEMWLGMRGYTVRIALPGAKPSTRANSLTQAKTFAMQEVLDWIARTPMRLEARR
jgi:hypothetical protein